MVDWDAPISSADAAKLIGVTPARLRQLFASGHIDRVAHGKTTAVAAAQGFARFWQEKAAEKTKGSSTSRVSDARAAEIEQRIAAKNRELVPAEDANAAVDHVVAACAEAFAALPAMLTRDIQERNRIEVIIKRAQGEVAKRLTEAGRLLAEGRPLPDAD